MVRLLIFCFSAYLMRVVPNEALDEFGLKNKLTTFGTAFNCFLCDVLEFFLKFTSLCLQ